MGKLKKTVLYDGVKYLILILGSIISLYPFIWVVISSLKNNNEIYGNPFALPQTPNWGNYVQAWKGAYVGRSFVNSILVCMTTLAILIIITAMACYILTRVYQHKILKGYFTLGIMVPIHALLIPSVLIFKFLHMQDNLLSLILIYVAQNVSFSMFILSGYMESIPKELDEAATIDGCTKVQTFFRVILPVAKPGIATVATLAFLNCWNDLLLSLVIIATPAKRTLTMAISALQGSFAANYGLLCAGFVITIIPVVIMYLLFQKQVISGMTAGAVKG
ncbi:MAG: carbohydrate ABC transporter permease [Lachnospiraceae bacterium]|nr:carbohydrate ABC transporter permease [Lachnospiraceae bacterium]